MKNALRWILVPPAAIAGGSLAMLAYGLFAVVGNWGFGMDPNAPFNRVYQLAVSGFVGGYAAIGAATITAPAHRRVTAVVLTTLACTLTVVAAVASIAQRQWWSVYQGAFVAFGAVQACRSAQTELDAPDNRHASVAVGAMK